MAAFRLAKRSNCSVLELLFRFWSDDRPRDQEPRMRKVVWRHAYHN